jgi:hypothetical protein
LSLLPYRGAVVSAQSADPTVPGSLAVTREEYDFGDTAFTPTAFPSVELRGSVHYPTNWLGGRLPLLVFLHGRHSVCFQGTTGGSFIWPCPAGQQPIPSFTGYDYIAQVLASNGYFVVSISADGINANDNSSSDLGAKARAELIQKHLDLWNGFNTAGGAPFGTKFVGKIDMQRIGTMGHSRGGEGVVRHFQLNQSLGSPYGIKAVFALAPVDFSRFVINSVPLAVLLPYCDGDVSDLQGVHFYDDARYNVPGDTAPKHTILVIGTNHNFYNTIWTPSIFPASATDDFSGSDPFCKSGGSGRLTEAQQRAAGLTYVSAFLRAYVGGESQFLPLLTAAAPPLPSAGTNQIYVSFHAPDDALSRRDVNRLLDASHLSANTIGGAVTPVALLPYDVCGGAVPEPTPCLVGQSNTRQPHTTPSLFSAASGLSQLRTGWNDISATLTNDVPPGQRNVSGFQALQFRASVNYNDVRNVAAQNFRVVLKDGTGATASVRVADFSPALFFPPGSTGFVPKVVLNTVRLPLSAFAGVNLTDVRSVAFVFDQQSQGALLITDVAFASAAHIALPAFSFDVCLKDDSSGSELVLNTATGNYAFCCSGGVTFTGVGRVTVHGSVVALVQGLNESDRRLTASMDRSVGRGTSSLQGPGGRLICSIIDRNTANNSCSCAAAP